MIITSKANIINDNVKYSIVTLKENIIIDNEKHFIMTSKEDLSYVIGGVILTFCRLLKSIEKITGQPCRRYKIVMMKMKIEMMLIDLRILATTVFNCDVLIVMLTHFQGPIDNLM